MIGIVDETAALDVDLAAAFLLEGDDLKREQRARFIQRQINREHAMMIGLAVAGVEIPEITEASESPDEEVSESPEIQERSDGHLAPYMGRNESRVYTGDPLAMGRERRQVRSIVSDGRH